MSKRIFTQTFILKFESEAPDEESFVERPNADRIYDVLEALSKEPDSGLIDYNCASTEVGPATGN
jgi:hypothetical protein